MHTVPRARLALVIPLLSLALVAGAAGGAGAQLCGDVDGNNDVSIADAVQVLRAAVSLSSSCSTAVCDVDGDGSITISDGVNVLRTAVALSAANACQLVNQQVSSVVGVVDSFMRVGIAVIPSSSSALRRSATTSALHGGATASADTIPCPNGGAISFVQNVVTFDQCIEDAFFFNGALSLVDPSTVQIDLSIGLLTTGESTTFQGPISFFDNLDGSTTTNGNFQIFSSSFGNFAIGLNNVTVDAAGFISSGALAVVAADASGHDLSSIGMSFDGSDTALVVAGFADGRNQPFSLDVNTGALTPVFAQ